MLRNPALRAPLSISLSAIAGALCRYYLGIWFIQLRGEAFPYSTILINLSGCFVMGFFVTLSLNQAIEVHSDLQLMITTGFLGSYTTFSTYELDTMTLLDRSLELDLLYWFGSALFGVLSLKLGAALAKFVGQKLNRNRSE